jgi:hypothetical protein
MSRHPNATGTQQRAHFLHPDVQRWMRHDAHRWIRHDAARFLPPGMDPADVYPALARQRAAEDAAFAAQIAKGYRLLAALREEVAQVKADLIRRRLAEQTKYSPTQPRVPAGNPRGGQWTDRSGGQGTGTSLAQPMGNVDVGDVSGSSELGDLFQITPTDTSREGEQVAGDVIRVCIVSGAGRSTVDGVKTFSVIYECAGGRTFRREGFGHNFPGIVLDPFR